jgi:quinol monooxygenase YgiN
VHSYDVHEEHGQNGVLLYMLTRKKRYAKISDKNRIVWTFIEQYVDIADTLESIILMTFAMS